MRNYTIEAVEQDLIAYRARNLVHPGCTQREYIQQRRERMKVYQLVLLVLAVVALCVGLWVL